jgi:aminoglycoside phosphotransferase (APT) family kinase protein
MTEYRAREVLRLIDRRMAAQVSGVTRRSGGELNDVYEIGLAGLPESVIVKVYADQWRWKLAKEVSVYRELIRQRISHVPAILHAESDGIDGGPAFLLMTTLPGEPLSEVGADLDEGSREGVHRQMGATLAAIHQVAKDAYGYLTTRILEPEPDNTAYMTRQFARKLREHRELAGDPALHDAIESHVADRAGLFASCPGPALCHNDYHAGNILVAQDEHGTWSMTGLVDMENALAADPLLDIAKTFYYPSPGGAASSDAATRSAFLAGYGELPGDWRERVDIYRLYHALELWDWYASIKVTGPLESITADLRLMVSA